MAYAGCDDCGRGLGIAFLPALTTAATVTGTAGKIVSGVRSIFGGGGQRIEGPCPGQPDPDVFLAAWNAAPPSARAALQRLMGAPYTTRDAPAWSGNPADLPAFLKSAWGGSDCRHSQRAGQELQQAIVDFVGRYAGGYAEAPVAAPSASVVPALREAAGAAVDVLVERGVEAIRRTPVGQRVEREATEQKVLEAGRSILPWALGAAALLFLLGRR